jgi:hypothetical protein
MAAPPEPPPASLSSTSRTSLTSKFKSRRKKKDTTSSTNSLASNDTGADGGLAASGELSRHDTGVDVSTPERIKTAPSEDGKASQDSSEGKRFGSLLRRRKTKKKNGRSSSAGADDLLDGDQSQSLVADEALYANGNISDSSLLHKSVASSLLTEDSEPEE